MNSNSLVVISDLHVGAGPLDDCDDELESNLVSFLDHLCTKDGAVELVINGDFMDFAQAEPWEGPELESESSSGIPLCFTEDQSIAKLEAIAQEHEPIFRALSDFLSSDPDNRLVILPGNHDVDLFWPRVQAVFRNKVRGTNCTVGSQLYFHLEQVYFPPSYPTVWIEHGNQYDPINSFYINEHNSVTGAATGQRLYWSRTDPPIFKDHQGCLRLYECAGTRFMIRFLNRLDADYPFVDNVKPFSKFLNLFGASALAGGYGPLKVSLAIYGLARYLVRSAVSHPDDLLGLEKDHKRQISALLQKVFESLSKHEHRVFSEHLAEHGFHIDRPFTMYLKNSTLAEPLLIFLSENLDLLDALPQRSGSYLGRSGEDNTLSLAKGSNIDETHELILSARKVLEQNCLAGVVMGHTHERVDDFSTLKYFNTGSWTRYYNFASHSLMSWSILQQNSYKLFPYQLNYVEIVPDRDEPIRMITYMERRGGVDD